MIRVILLLLLCSTAHAATDEFADRVVWVTSDQPVRICMLPPSPAVVSCTAVPPLFCEEVDGSWFISLDPAGMPPQTEMYHWVTYTAGNESRSQLVNITVYRFAPHSINVNLSAIDPTDLKNKIDEVMAPGVFTIIMMVGLLAILYVNRRRFR